MCTLDDCDKAGRSKTGAGLCPMHYHRQYRHGSVTTTAIASGVTASAGRRYRTMYRPDHPLAHKHGNVYVHRAVLYDKIGAGPHPCHWCNTPLSWVAKGQPRCLYVDHLDGYGDNNQIDNLVPSCHRCNSGRGSSARHLAFVAAGWWSEHDTIARLKAGRPGTPPLPPGHSA